MADTPPVVVIDVLNSLLEAELSSIFRTLETASPYLSRATAEVRGPLHEMALSSYRRADELVAMLESLGGEVSPRTGPPEEPYLSYLSLKFLLPKLVEDQRLAIKRYENALRAISNLIPQAATLLKRQLAEHKQQLEILNAAA